MAPSRVTDLPSRRASDPRASRTRGDLPIRPAVTDLTKPPDRNTVTPTKDYFTSVDSLKIGRMIAIAMKPTIEPMITIISGSIMLVTVLMVSRSCRA